MRLIVTRKDLLALVARCQGVADKKSALPALANILLSATGAALGGALTVAATDLYTAALGSLRADVHAAGSIALPADDLFARLKALDDGPIDITVDADACAATLKTVGKKRSFILHGIPGGEFPKLPAPPSGATSRDVPASVLLDLIARAGFAISNDTTRPNVNSGLFEFAGATMRLAATDAHRCAVAEHTLLASSSGSLLVPQKAVTELRRMAEDADDGASFAISEGDGWAFFALAGVTFATKVHDPEIFPPYQQIIPSGGKPCRVKSGPLSAALKACSLASPDKASKGVELHFAAGKINVSAKGENGSASDEIEADYASGEIRLGVNAQLLLDAIGAAGGDEVILSLGKEGLDPILVKPASGSGSTGVVMPMRL